MLPPEVASTVGDLCLRSGLPWRAKSWIDGTPDPRLRVAVAGVEYPSPVGAAAGIDKECRFLMPLLDLGFGFATGGTVTLAARPGNPKPRLLRLPESRAIINAMGFPGSGLERAESRLRALTAAKRRLLASVAGTIEEEVIECHRRLQVLVSGIELNISSPNTAGLRVFHEPARLRGLIESLAAVKTVPLMVKLPPWEKDDRGHALGLAETSVSAGADGFIIANSRPVEDARLRMGRGGLSGAPLFEQTVRMVAEVRAALPGAALIGCGGVSSASDAWRLLASGADAVQLYTGLIYEGPSLPARINRQLLAMMDKFGVKTVADISGAPPL